MSSGPGVSRFLGFPITRRPNLAGVGSKGRHDPVCELGGLPASVAKCDARCASGYRAYTAGGSADDRRDRSEVPRQIGSSRPYFQPSEGKKLGPWLVAKSRNARAAGERARSVLLTTYQRRMIGKSSTSRHTSLPLATSAAIVCAEMRAIPISAMTACLIVSFEPSSILI